MVETIKSIFTREDFKQYKQSGKKVFHRSYLLLVFLCLVLFIFGTENGQAVRLLRMPSQLGILGEAETSSVLRREDVYRDIINGGLGKGLQTSNQILENVGETIGGHASLGRTRGVLAGLVNSMAAGRLQLKVISTLRKATETDKGAVALYLLLDLLRIALIWILIRNVYSAILRRIFLEVRLYDKIPITDLLHFAEVRCWLKASWTMFVKAFYFYLWSLTIVGGFIKYYSYYAVAYIVAENPGIGTKEAIRLSREMMDGHKMEAFLLDVSYLGWHILQIVTLGLSDIFYGYPYRLAGKSEFYVRIREMAKEKGIAGSEKLDDRYLFERADKITLYETYFDVVDQQAYIHENKVELSKTRAFLTKWLGLWVGSLNEKRQFEKMEGMKYRMYFDTKRRDGRAYPSKLNPRTKDRKIRLKHINFLRSYSIWTLLLLFLLFALIGWGWEVSLYLVRDGMFVNRGVLHGPWLPIYGAGGLIALMLCSRFRRHPEREFVFSIILCGAIEYLGAYLLETVYHEKWWSYEGNFLNLHGRICAEGLIVFGIACMLVVYLIAPIFDYLISKLKNQIIVLLAVGLMGIFVTDLAYSSKHPNMAEGAIEAHDDEVEGQSDDPDQ